MVRPYAYKVKILRKQRQNLLLNRAGDARLFFADVDIHFAADSEFLQIDSRFDGVAGFGDQMAGVVGFKAVHVDAVAVHRLADVVAGAVKEIFSVAGFFDHAAGGLVHLPALQRFAGLDGLLDQFDGGIASFAHHFKNLGNFVGHFRAQIPDPGDVVIDAAGGSLLTPDVEEEQVAFLDRG